MYDKQGNYQISDGKIRMIKAGKSIGFKTQNILRIELLPGYLLILISFAKLLAELSFEYNWDIDHLMYSSGRLLLGELNWTIEFEEKLPIVIFLLAVPAMLKSVQAWQLISAIGIVIGCIAVYRLAFACIRDHLPELNTRAAKTAAFYGAAIVACLFAFLPGGFTHINAIAASFAIVAIASVDAARRAYTKSSMRVSMVYLLGAFSASLAIGMRPYFLFPLLLAGVWSALKIEQHTTVSARYPAPVHQRLFTRPALIWIILWVSCIGFFGILVNVFPYVSIGRSDVLVAGLKMMAQDFIFRDTFSNIVFQSYTLLHASEIGVLFIAFWMLSLVCLPILVYHKIKNGNISTYSIIDIGYLVIVCPILLELTIILKHFWPHYLQMFVPFIGISAAFFGAFLMATKELSFSRLQIQGLVLACLILIFVSGKEEIADSLERIAKFSTDRHHPQAQQLAEFKDFLESRPADKRDFLNPTHMHFHWQLAESRRGFPHAAHTKRIISGKWRDNVVVPEPLQLPTSPEAYCDMLEANGPSIVVELETSDVVIKCFLENSDSKYSPVDNNIASYAENLVIFERVR